MAMFIKKIHFYVFIAWLVGGVTCYLQNKEIEDDFRFISYKDLLSNGDRFSTPNVTTYSTLLFDVAREQVIVGARDVLYRMSLNLQPREVAVWEATQEMIDFCQRKGQTDKDCRNYIKVLQSYGNQLYACGTYAFSPSCSWRQMENLSVIGYDKGVGKCPFNPNANITTLMTESGKLFVGSPTDFSGSDSAILGIDISQDTSRLLRSQQYNSKWLNNPQFVGSFEAGEFVYFVFRETAVEYINCGKVVYSRIARVCKSDPGGEHILKDNWTSFLKARLNCSIPGEYPFYFNEVQGITYSSESNMLYATFTTPINSVHGSAVCAFNISAINLAFSGPFKYQENIGSTWESVDSTYRSHFECKKLDGPVSTRHNHLLESSRYQMMDKAIQPITSYPLYISQLERLSHISLDIVSTKFYLNMHVLYVATESGLVKKISVLPVTKKTCVIEMWQPEESSSIGIHVMQFLKGTESLYIGTEKSFLKIPAHHCKRHVSKASCLNAMDPYCGWDELKEACTPPPRDLDTLEYWIQNATDCPILTAPIDGGWSSWSDWFKCAQSNDQPSEDFSSNVDSCLCRKRTCNNPSPKNGGKPCKGIDIAVMNCTVNGGWTEWSAWSACSQTCGVAVKTRRRTCGNPKPAHGGRVCVGPDRSEIYCSHLPPCPVPKQTPIDGGWGPWGSWGECSSQCGGGFKIRRRKCNDPEPQNGGLDCSGCHIEYELCNTHSCPEMKKLSSWTPWLTQINESANSNELIEKRFRFSCRAATTDSNSLRLSLYKEETRICKNSTCLRSADNGDDIIWSDWSPCNASCGGGQQFRVKLCDRTACEGQTRMARACNMQPCAHWTNWSEWSLCSESGKQIRYRKCMIDNPSPEECLGSDYEESNCIPINEGIYYSSAFIWASLLGTAVVFSILSIVCTYFFLKPKRIKNFKNEFKRSSNSPSYDSQPNAYSSLPTKDILEPKQKTKRQPSFNSGTVANRNLTNVHGTLVKANNIPSNHTPKALANNLLDCETGTIKRNSHGLNNHKTFRTIDDEKF